MSAVDEVKQRLNIVEVISAYVPLKKAGRNYKGLCPFHGEKTPSFVVFPDSQHWHCFGACGEGGDAFTFVQKREGMDFGDALRFLAQRAGIQLQTDGEAAAQEAEVRSRLRGVLEAAAVYFCEQLASAAGEQARAYLAKRQVGQKAIAEFRLGYAPDSWRALATHLLAEGYSREELAEAGVTSQKDDGIFYDRFRNRLMFPICDGRGSVVGFGARSLDGSEPKYLNSPQTPLFDKGKLLYALDKARHAIMQAEAAVIVEGYMDAIAAHEAGYGNVVASMGTAISEAQLQSLARLAKRYVLALDPDSAGSVATLRGVAVAGEALRGEGEPTFYGGLLRFEKRVNGDIRVAILPQGKDPDELIRQDATAWEKLIAEAKSVVDYYFDVAMAEADLADAKGKVRFARRLLPVIGAVPDPFERAHHIERVARLIQVDPALVERELTAMRRGSNDAARTSPIEPQAPAIAETLGLEEYVLWFLLQSPEALPSANGMLTAAKAEPLSGADFLEAENKPLFAVLQQVGPAGRLAVRAALSGDLRRRFDWLESTGARAPESSDNYLWHDGVCACLFLRSRRLKHDIRLLQLAQEGAEDPGELREYAIAVDKTCQQMQVLTRALASRSLLRTEE